MSGDPSVGTPNPEWRVLSYNVRSLRDDRSAVVEVIRTVRPDIAFIQEAPRFFRWRTRCAQLAADAGMYVVTGGRSAGDVLLLAALRVTIRWARDVRLSHQPGLHRRGIALAGVELAGRRAVVASIHLGLEPAQRLRHVAELLAVPEIAEGVDPVIIAGDVNEEPSGPAWRRLAARNRDAYGVAPAGRGETYSARQPRTRIDGIFVDPRFQVIRCEVPDLPAARRASDHLPVLAVLRLAADADARAPQSS